MHRIKTKLKIFKLVYGLAFLLAITDALVSYVQSSYLNQYISLGQIGLLISGASVAVLLISTFYHQLIIKLSNYQLTVFLFLISLVASYLLYASQTTAIIVTAFAARYVCFMFLATSLDVFLENISDNAHTGAIRTKFLTFINLAWLASPLIMGFIVGGNNNYQAIYLISTIVLLVAFLLLIINQRHLASVITYKRHDFKKALSLMIKQKKILSVWLANIVLNAFYLIASLYIPLYLHNDLGISWPVLSIVFTIMLLPFVMLQIPAGWLADRYWGEKELMISGNLIMAVSLIILFFTTTTNPVVWAVLLFLSRVGAALAEAMQETYFYKQVDVQDVGLINLFRRSRSLGWLLAALSAFLLLFFLSLSYLFMFMALVLLGNAWYLRTLPDTK